MKINDFLCFLLLSWCHDGPKFVQVGCNLAQVSSKVSREGSSCHQHGPSWCQHGLKGPSWRQNAFMAVQVHARVALSDSKLAPIWAKLGPKQARISPSGSQVGHNCSEAGQNCPRDCIKADITKISEKSMKNNDCSSFLCPS